MAQALSNCGQQPKTSDQSSGNLIRNSGKGLNDLRENGELLFISGPKHRKRPEKQRAASRSQATMTPEALT